MLSGPLGPAGISAALSCLILLTLLFFGVYGALFLRALTADGDAWNAGLIAARRGVANEVGLRRVGNDVGDHHAGAEPVNNLTVGPIRDARHGRQDHDRFCHDVQQGTGND